MWRQVMEGKQWGRGRIQDSEGDGKKETHVVRIQAPMRHEDAE
jgi:hypothetical protein